MKKRMLSILLCWVLLFPFVAAAGPFTDLFVFGDSLSDQGNVRDLTVRLGPPYLTVPPNEYTDGTNYGRFTNGLNYIDGLAASLGLISTTTSLGGHNYAYGGARTDSQSVGGVPVPGALSILDQRISFLTSLAGGSADANALFVVWAGANNLIDIVETEAADIDSSYDPTADLTKAVTDIKNIVGSLAANGARNILVPNLPDFGVLPLVTGGGPQVLGATYLTTVFNTSLGSVLDGVEGVFNNLNLVRFDTFGLFNAVLADPAAFGFSNTTAGCYSKFGVAGGTPCANPDEYVSWDGFHPTSAIHSLLASRMASAVPEPNIFVLIAIGVFSLGAIVRRAQKPV
jgi:phospholipase/lecithinase/hemolysin